MKAETAEYLLSLEKKIESKEFSTIFHSFVLFSFLSFVYDEYWSGKDFAEWSIFSKILAPYAVFHFWFVIVLWKIIIKPNAENTVNDKKAKEILLRESRKKEIKKKSNDEYLFGKK